MNSGLPNQPMVILCGEQPAPAQNSAQAKYDYQKAVTDQQADEITALLVKLETLRETARDTVAVLRKYGFYPEATELELAVAEADATEPADPPGVRTVLAFHNPREVGGAK